MKKYYIIRLSMALQCLLKLKIINNLIRGLSSYNRTIFVKLYIFCDKNCSPILLTEKASVIKKNQNKHTVSRLHQKPIFYWFCCMQSQSSFFIFDPNWQTILKVTINIITVSRYIVVFKSIDFFGLNICSCR